MTLRFAHRGLVATYGPAQPGDDQWLDMWETLCSDGSDHRGLLLIADASHARSS